MYFYQFQCVFFSCRHSCDIHSCRSHHVGVAMRGRATLVTLLGMSCSWWYLLWSKVWKSPCLPETQYSFLLDSNFREESCNVAKEFTCHVFYWKDAERVSVTFILVCFIYSSTFSSFWTWTLFQVNVILNSIGKCLFLIEVFFLLYYVSER